MTIENVTVVMINNIITVKKMTGMIQVVQWSAAVSRTQPLLVICTIS